MVRYMADSIDCANFSPPNVNVPGRGIQQIALDAGYSNGSFHASSQACGTTPVQIDVNGTNPGADVLDIETGDATPSSAPNWVFAHNAHGGTTFPAVLYCNRSNISAIANYCANAGLLPGRDFWWWISTLDGTTSVPDMTGVLAVQAWGSNYFNDRNIDLSVVYNDAFKPTAPPPPPIGDELVVHVPLPPGTNQHYAFGCAGYSKLRFHMGFGDQLVIHQIVPIGDTPNQPAPAAEYDPGFDENATNPPQSWTWVSDRDGPWLIPQSPFPATEISIRYDFIPAANSAGVSASLSNA